MRRRNVLKLVGGAGASVAGCSGPSAAPSPRTDAPTSSVPPETRVEVPPCPESPDTLTAETAGRFASEFERAYRARLLLRRRDGITPPIQFRGLRESPPGERDGSGFIIRLNYRLSYQQMSDGQTPVAVDVDLPSESFHYFIGSQQVLRAKTEYNQTVDPLRKGSDVRCPPK